MYNRYINSIIIIIIIKIFREAANSLEWHVLPVPVVCMIN